MIQAYDLFLERKLFNLLRIMKKEKKSVQCVKIERKRARRRRQVYTHASHDHDNVL